MSGDTALRWRRLLRLAILCELLGLGLATVSVLWLVPATFMVFMGVGVPLILVGLLAYLVYLAQHLSRLVPSPRDPS